MKKKTVWSIILSIISIILIVILGWYSYTLLKNENKNSDIDLYSLVPSDAIAIWEAKNVGDIFNSINKPSFYKKFSSLNISNILTELEENQSNISDPKIHRLNAHMNDLILSFHYPNTNKDQVLYCKFTGKEQDDIKQYLINNIAEESNSVKKQYKDEYLYLYPVYNHDTLVCYYHSNAIAISYQEHLIEQVIDAYLYNECAILSDSIFTTALKSNHSQSGSNIYVRASKIPFDANIHVHPEDWVKFNLKMNRDAIYLSGIHFEEANTKSFTTIIKEQEPAFLPESNTVPETAILINQYSISDIKKIFTQINQKDYPLTNCSNLTEKVDSCMFDYFQDNAKKEISNYIFYSPYSKQHTLSVTKVSLHDKEKAEKELADFLSNWENTNNLNKYNRTNNYLFSEGNTFIIYKLPTFTLLNKIASISDDNESGIQFGCFYNDNLLLSSNEASLYAYVDMINKRINKENDIIYNECIAGLSSESNCVLLADLNEVITAPHLYGNLIPSIFLENKSFFEDFMFTFQYTKGNDSLFPYISLIYKGGMLNDEKMVMKN